MLRYYRYIPDLRKQSRWKYFLPALHQKPELCLPPTSLKRLWQYRVFIMSLIAEKPESVVTVCAVKFNVYLLSQFQGPVPIREKVVVDELLMEFAFGFIVKMILIPDLSLLIPRLSAQIWLRLFCKWQY